MYKNKCTSLICNISSCKRAACIKTNVHVSGKLKSVMRAYLLSVVVPFVISSELLIKNADVGLNGGDGRGGEMVEGRLLGMGGEMVEGRLFWMGGKMVDG